MPFHPSRFMGDGPVALLVGRPSRCDGTASSSPGRVVLVTNNGEAHPGRRDVGSIAWRRWLAALSGLRRGS